MSRVDCPGLVSGNPIGSELCLACGLCCEGVLHSYAAVRADELERVWGLGLNVGRFGSDRGFRLPCVLYQDHRCSIYDQIRPHVCAAYQCRLLKKYLVGTISREQGLDAIQRARELLADIIGQGPPVYSFEQLCSELGEDWDSGRGMFGSPELRQQNSAFLLTVAKLMRYLQKHFWPVESIKPK